MADPCERSAADRGTTLVNLLALDISSIRNSMFSIPRIASPVYSILTLIWYWHARVRISRNRSRIPIVWTPFVQLDPWSMHSHLKGYVTELESTSDICMPQGVSGDSPYILVVVNTFVMLALALCYSNTQWEHSSINHVPQKSLWRFFIVHYRSMVELFC